MFINFVSEILILGVSQNMNTHLLVNIIIALIIIGLAIASIYYNKKSKQESNYKVFFTVRIIFHFTHLFLRFWFPLDLSTKNDVFSIMGLVFLVIGLINKNKWRDEKSWSDLSPNEKNSN